MADAVHRRAAAGESRQILASIVEVGVITPARDMAFLSVMSHFPVNRLDLLGDKRQRVYVEARWAVAKLLFDHAGYSVSEIGRATNRDHSTIMHSLAQVRKKIATNIDFAVKMAAIEEEYHQREAGVRRAIAKQQAAPKTEKSIQKAMALREDPPSPDKIFAKQMSGRRFENAMVAESKASYRPALSQEAARIAREI